MANVNPDGTPAKAANKTRAKATQAAAVATTGGYDPSTFAAAVLTKLGLPTSPANMDFFTSWESAEGGNWSNTATYNPLNTSLPMKGEAGTMGTQGNIRRYSSWQQGIDATVKTLQSHHYTGILQALANSDAPGAVDALKASPWDVNHYSAGFPLGAGAAYASRNGATPDGQANQTGAAGLLSTGQPGNNTNEADYLSTLSPSFGYLTAFLNDPQIGPIIRDAASGGWTDNHMLDALSKTDWWQTTGQTARQWQSLLSTDPATAQQALTTSQSHVTALAQSSGITLTPQDAYHIAYAANMFGWSDLQMQQAVGAQYKYNPNQIQNGAAGTDVAQMKQLAAEYLVPISDHTIQKYAQAALSGNYSMSDFQSYVKQQALSRFSGNKVLEGQINAGITPKTAFEPYAQVASQLLEIPADQVNFMDPKWSKAVNQVDPKLGVSAPMSQSDWAKTLMTDPTYGYDKTAGARSEATTLSSNLGQAMGFI